MYICTGEQDTNVRVAVRVRPLSKKELGNNESPIIKIISDNVVITNPNGSGEEHSFAFDLIYDENTHQGSLMTDIGAPILSKAFAGYNGTIFAYGQTGSGKTWSMQVKCHFKIHVDILTLLCLGWRW